MSDEIFTPTEDRGQSTARFDKVTDRDVMYIGLIVTRFLNFLKERGVRTTEAHAYNVHMDLGAAHSNGCTLDFESLLKMDLTPFVEDIIGISRNIDRSNGKLLNGYRPRCARGLIIH